MKLQEISMNIAFVGCGYAADFYAATLRNYPHLVLAGVFDINEERAMSFSRALAVRYYASLRELLEDPDIAIVVNLTNIRAHYSITKACLEAGKHVYSEKPLAEHFSQAEELIGLALSKSLQLACAPANILGEPAQTLWELLRNKAIGEVWLAYAELDDGAIHQMNYRSWRSSTGVYWPFQDEFEMGCVLEHAPYYLVWLTTFFGSARSVRSFSTCLVPDKYGKFSSALGEDLSIACITFSSGVVARLTCSVLAPKNHSLIIVGSEGVLTLEDCWQLEAPIYIQERLHDPTSLSGNSYLSEKRLVKQKKREGGRIAYRNTHNMDFAGGIAELAEAIERRRPCRLSAQHALHIVEILTALKEGTVSCEITTSFPQMAPMVWTD
jgi:predicted dehydrogenase